MVIWFATGGKWQRLSASAARSPEFRVNGAGYLQWRLVGDTTWNDLALVGPGGATPAPTITSVSPSSQVAGTGATTVTITGTNLTGVTDVVLKSSAGAVVATLTGVTVVSATQVTASLNATSLTAGASATLQVTGPGGVASTAFTITNPVPVPTITTVTPGTLQQGGGARTVTVTGTGLTGVTGIRLKSGSTVVATLSGVSSSSSTTATGQVNVDAVTPGTYDVELTTPGGTVTKTGALVVSLGAPVISTLGPSSVTSGSGNQSVTIGGSYLGSATAVRLKNGSTTVATLTVTANTATSITATLNTTGLSAASGLTVEVVTAAGSATSSATITVNASASPAISSVSTLYGNKAQTLTVAGTSLAGVTSVDFGDYNPGDGVWASDFTVTPTAQSGTGMQLAVTKAQANLMLASGRRVMRFNYAGGAVTFTPTFVGNPVVSTVSPGSTTAGTGTQTLTITGTGLSTATGVVLKTAGGAVYATLSGLSAASDTSLTATLTKTGLSATSGLTVEVTSDGGVGSKANAFAVSAPASPVISSLSPTYFEDSSSPISFDINGSGFTGVNKVEVSKGSGFAAGTTAASPGARFTVTVVSDSKITVSFNWGSNVGGDGKDFSSNSPGVYYYVRVTHPTNGVSNADKSYGLFPAP